MLFIEKSAGTLQLRGTTGVPLDENQNFKIYTKISNILQNFFNFFENFLRIDLFVKRGLMLQLNFDSFSNTSINFQILKINCHPPICLPSKGTG